MEDKEPKTDIVESLKKQLADAEKQTADYLAGWQRARADLINYKKEQAEFLEKLRQFAVEGLVLKLLPVLDSFEEAFKHAKNNNHDNDKTAGLRRIYEQFWTILKKEGAEEISQTGTSFDPKIHESVGEAEGKEVNLVAEVVQKGYTLNGRLLRPARVKITR